MNLNLKSVLLGVALALGATSVATAQSSDGNISGMSATGETIIVEGADTGFHREIEIKKDGKYLLRRVPAGVYIVQVKGKDGSSKMTRTVTVQAGRSTRVQ